jgi:hypothetical protein
VQAVVQDFQTLQHVSPVLSFVIQPLIQHVHNLVKVGGTEWCRRPVSSLRDGVGRRRVPVVGDSGDIGHVCAGGAPWIVTGRYGMLSITLSRVAGGVAAYHFGP